MEAFTSNTKPNLIDNNIMMQLEMRKNMIQSGGEDVGMCSRMWTKMKQDISAFFYNNFWILLIVVLLGYVLWRRYRWYRISMKTAKEKKKRKQEIEKEKKLMMKIKRKQREASLKAQRKEPPPEETDLQTYEGTGLACAPYM